MPPKQNFPKESELFMINFKECKLLCVICKEILASNRVFNAKRHFDPHHAKDIGNLNEIEKKKITLLKSEFTKSTDSFLNQNYKVNQNLSLSGSFVISKILAENSKSFRDADFIRECIKSTVNIICLNPQKNSRKFHYQTQQ